jgi:hypothetical protein
MAKKTAKPEGRPTKYDSSLCKKVKKLCLLGATDKDLADFLEVTESTINNWKIEHPEFLESIKKGKKEADANVANRLYKRALGYSHPDTDVRVCDGMIVKTPMIKHYPPDTTAGIFWLKNRQPERWRDKQEIQHSVDPEVFEIGGKKINF